MISEKLLGTLKGMGLTEYEARAYTILASAGPSTAGDVSALANVPYSRVYDILSKLARRGWVEVQPGRPARYRARSPAEAIRLTKIEQDRKFKEASEVVVKELEPVYEQKAEAKKPDIWVIRGERSLLSRIREMLARAQVEALITLPTVTKELARLEPLLPILGAKNLALRVLTVEKLKLKPTLPNLEIRHRKPLFGGGVIIDGKEALLLLMSGEEKLGIWSDEVGLAKFAKEYFEYLWKDARK